MESLSPSFVYGGTVRRLLQAVAAGAKCPKFPLTPGQMIVADELNDFFEHAGVPFHWVGPDGTILRANGAELELLGYSESEYVGRNIAEFHADEGTIADILDRLAAGERLHRYEARLRCKDGSLKDVAIDSSVFRDASDKFVHTRCVTIDLTERRRLDEAARHLAALVASSDDAIVSKDLDGIVRSWNAGAVRLFGYSAEEIVGRSIRTIIPPELQSEEDMVLLKIRQGDRVEHFETIRMTKDGRRIPVSLTVSPIRDEQGRIVGASKIARDITERLEMENDLRRSIEVKDAFVSLVSHELRTPIATILGNAQILLRRGERLIESARHAALRDVISEAERLQQIVENLLLLSRLTAGQLELRSVALSEVVRSAVGSQKRQHPGRAIQLQADAEPNVLADATLLSMVFQNLIGNAIKYSPADQQIDVVISAPDGRAEVHVLDRGLGIAPGDEDRVFEPFFRATAAKEAAAGMGLGLSVCKRIADALGGVLVVSRRSGGGSEFVFSLDVAGGC